MQDSATESIQTLGIDAQPNLETADNPPEALSAPVLCCYINTTGRIQVARLSHLSEGEWEHILFPSQHFMFEAPPEAMLEIYKSPALSITPPEYIPCHSLQVQSD
jgi:Domain of unknown function (DUF1830)